MRTSDHGVEFIASYEGFRDHPYRDPGRGLSTIGYGHTGPGTPSMGKITHARGLEPLAGDLGNGAGRVHGLSLELTQAQFDALVSIAFSCGGGIVAPAT